MKWQNFVFNNHYWRLRDDVCEYLYFSRVVSVVTFPACHCVFLIHEEPKLSPWSEEYPAQPGQPALSVWLVRRLLMSVTTHAISLHA